MSLRFVLALACLCCSLEANAQEDEGWDWRGQTNLRIENYGTRGDASATPYPISNTHGTLGINFDAERRINPFDFSRFSFTGTQSASRYYSTRDGFFPERINFTHQSGTAALPYQAQAGDYLGAFSLRTLQTALRGGLLELQPQSGSRDRRHSLMFLSGAAGQSYRQFQWRDNWFNGGSYLYEAKGLGRFALNWVNNFRQDDAVAGTLARRQNVWSGAAEIPFALGAQSLRFETEWARFSGDHDGIAGAASGQERKGAGFFSELVSRGTKELAPLNWRLRFERYGQDYRPAGAVVSPDRISREAFAGWRFATGLNLRGRLQMFRDGWDSGNLTRTNTGGLTLTGPLVALLLPGWTGNLDSYLQTIRNQAAPTDTRVFSARGDASRTFANGVTLRLGFGYLDRDARATAAGGSITRDLLATLSHAAQFMGWRGSVSYGATLRQIDGGASESRQFLPLASASLAQGRHSLQASLSYAHLNQLDPAQTDTRNTSIALAWRYDLPQDKLGLELNTNHRNAVPGSYTEAYRVMFTWTHLFEKVQVAQFGRAPLGPAPGAGPLDLRELAPGRSFSTLENRMQSLGLKAATRPAPNLLVYDYRMLEEIDERQRVAIQTLGGGIERSGLVIEFEDVGNVNTVAQTFERVRQALIRRYGVPASVFDRGEFRATLADDVATDQFIRLSEWRTAEGTIRFGIPRRLDRIVRMEVQIARSFPDPTQTRWSFDDLR
ncbi:MAG: hypothetical protein AB1452_12230 [Pseudomonadota bacterium]